MNAKWTLSLAAIALMGTMITAQVSQEQRAKRADEIMRKVRQVDLLNQLLPLVLTKQQLDKILPAVEKARNEVRKAEQVEFDMLTRLEPKLDKAIEEGVKQQKLPSEEVMKEAGATLRTFNLRRMAVVADNVDAVMAVFEKELNAGQKKAAANALKPGLFDPTLDASQWTDQQKMRFFVQMILLDREAYGLMVQMSQDRK